MKKNIFGLVMVIILSLGLFTMYGCDSGGSGGNDSGAVIDVDGEYTLYSTGVVYASNTGLEWVAGPDNDTDWYEAESWVNSLTTDGGGWSMPTIAQLETLYHDGRGSRNMTDLLVTTGWWVWSGETYSSSSAWAYNFITGYGNSYNRDSSDSARGFAVRSR